MEKQLSILSSKQTLWGLIVLALTAVVTVFIFDWIGPETIQHTIAQGGPLAPLVYIGFKALTYIIAPLGSGPIVMLSGTIFGPLWGIIFSVIGDVIGGSVNFWIAHFFGRSLIIRFVGKKGIAQVDQFYETVGEWKGLLFARVALSGFYDFISYAVGLTKLPYYQYLLVSLLGGILPTAYTVLFGAALLEHRTIFFSILGGIIFLTLLLIIFDKKESSSKKANSSQN